MKNKLKVTICILTVIIIAAITIFLYIYDIKSNNNKNITLSNNTENSKTITTTSNTEQDDIDWSKYKTYNLSLSENTTITKEGIYNITGSITDGSIKVNTEGNVKLILNSVTITNNSGAAILVENSKNTYIELKGTNVITVKTTETEDAAIYSHDDLFFEGDGTLSINSNYDGIASKDDLTFYSGTFKIKTDDDGIKGKDSVTIKNGTFTINSKGDGIKTTNETEKGEIVIENGAINITTTKDAIQSISDLTIDEGTFNIKTESNTNDNSSKGLKAEKNITINGGTYKIQSYEDGIHANGMVIINGGSLNITSQEGIEATYVKIENGTINIEASDDGINATNKSNKYTATIEITGGDITIKMGQGDTDAIDSNGNLYITGGKIDITAQSPFDYDGESKFTGGTVTVNGEKVTTLTNQMMGGHNGMNGGPQGNDQNMIPRGGRH